MKKLVLTILALIIITAAFAQVPQAMNYQAVARNSLGQIVPSQSIGVRFTILDGTGTNTYYQETHTTTTNNFGLFTLAIGKGTAISGTIGAIDWSTGGDKYLKVEIAPQGGTTYTIQGTTQLISVPYSLFAEKTRLIGGNAITITNGNTINANYVAGAGITITGNTISATAGNAWLLNGNTGTTAANFLGTTDNLPVNIRTNNLQRFSISESNIAGTNNISYVSAGQQSNFSTNPVQFSVYGKDISGFTLPFGIAANVAGMNWSASGGTNNTVGRLARLSQFTVAAGPDYNFFDLGIDQQSDFFISDQGTWNGSGGQFPKKMLTISPSDFVGINFNWGEHPTANFHTKGTVRFEGVNTNNTFTRIVAMDANGNIASRDASTLLGNDWSLLGNTGTTAANFIGTTDNMPVNFRTNNLQRLSISESNIVGSNNAAYVSAGQLSNFATNPMQINIWGKDISGTSIPLFLAENVSGMTWSASGGSNNTAGRFFRMSQWTTATGPDYNFYDMGIDQQSDFYISDQKTWATGGGQFPRKMITITPTGFTGINFNWGEHPTANFHTKGTLRFEGVVTNNSLTRIVAMDANGNISSRDASTLTGTSYWAADANGIHNSNTGNVGIGGNSRNDAPLSISGTTALPWTADINSTNDWQTAVNLKNSTTNSWFQVVVGGSTNTVPAYGVGPGNFGIVRAFGAGSSTIPLIITQNDFVGISNHNGGTNFEPKARLHVTNGDVYIDQVGSGVIMKSPNGQCWRMTVSNAGTPVFTAIPCP